MANLLTNWKLILRSLAGADLVMITADTGPMLKLILILAVTGPALVGCSSASNVKRTPVAWDGLGRNPDLPAGQLRRPVARQIMHDPNKERMAVLLTLRPYSNAWWAVRAEISAEDDRRLREKLIICGGCGIARPVEQTGSIK